MKKQIICFLALFYALTCGAYAYDYPSKGKKLHYEFKNEAIAFVGCKHKGDRGVLHCYDLKTNTMWEVDNPWLTHHDHEGTPMHHPDKSSGSTYSSTSGLSPREQLGRQAEIHSSTQDEA